MESNDRESLWAQAATGSVSSRLDALFELVEALHAEGNTEEELAVAAAAIDVAREGSDESQIANAIEMHAGVQWDAEQYIEAAANTIDAAQIYERLGEWHDAAEAWYRAAMILLDGEVQEGVLQYVERGSAAFTQCTSFDRQAGGLLVISHKIGNLGNTDDAVVLALRARQIGIDNADAGIVFHANAHLLHALTVYERYDEARDLLQASLRDARAERRYHDITQLVLIGGVTLAKAGAVAEALALVADAIAETADHVRIEATADLMVLQGRILVNECEDFDAALTVVQHAEQLLRNTHDTAPQTSETLLDVIVFQAELHEAMDCMEQRIAKYLEAHACATGRQQYEQTVPVIEAYMEDDEPQQALDFMDATPDFLEPWSPPGCPTWVWRRTVRAEALCQLERWEEADVVARDALSRAEPGTPSRWLGELHYVRGRVVLPADVEACLEHLERAMAAYKEDECEQAMEELREQFLNIAALVASKAEQLRP